MKCPDLIVGKQLQVGAGEAKCLGKGEDVIRGSSYIEGPLEVGDDEAFDDDAPVATVMIGPEANTDVKDHAKRSLHVKGNVDIEGDGKTDYGLEVSGGSSEPLHVKGDVICDAISPTSLAERFKVADQKPVKPFDIDHPTKEGYRLRYACIEGPEAAVYTRGRVCNGKNVIDLPDYWSGLIDYETLTIQLTAIGSHQNVIVKRVSPMEQKIYLQAQGGMPVDCFYHIMAERKDVNKLIVEYEGNSFEDYPDPKYNDPKYSRQNIVTG